MSTWHWPQWTVAILWALGLLIHAYNHGQKPATEWRYNFPVKLVCIAIYVWLLWAGGFWDGLSH